MSKPPMSPDDRDRAIDEALAGRAPTGHPDLEGVAAFAAELRAKAAQAPVRASPAVVSLLRGEKDLATYVELAAERTRRRPALVWVAAAAVAVALGGVAVAQPWQRGGTTPTAASVTDTVDTTSVTAATPTTTEPPLVTTTELLPLVTTAATVPPVTARPTKPTTPATSSSSTVKTRPPEPPVTTAPPPPPPPPPGLDEAKARWRTCATGGQQEGLTQDQIKARCGAEPNLDGYRAARTTWETCLRGHPRSGPTAICGPEPDPAAYGFVPPVWQKP